MADNDVELNRQVEIDQFMWLHFKPEMLRLLNIPSASYPIRRSSFDQLIATGGLISISDIMRGLMGWLDVTDEPEPIWEVLRRLMHRHFPPSREKDAGCEFLTDDLFRHRFRIGSIDKVAPAIGWHCGDWAAVFACASEIELGRLQIAAPQPMSLQIAHSVFDHSLVRCDHASDDNFELALFKGRSPSSFQEWRTGQMALVYWYNGYGKIGEICRDGRHAQVRTIPAVEQWLAPNQVATMVAVGNGFL